MPDNPDGNMKNEKFYSQLSTYYKRHMGFRSTREWSKEDFQIVLRAAGETETTQKNIQD
jgi:DNA primase catalytic subunit